MTALKKAQIAKQDKFVTKLKKGDLVVVAGGGNSRKHKSMRGKVGKIIRFLPKHGRVVVEGLRVIKRHKRAQSATDSSGIIEKDGSVPISKVMYFSERLKKGVRIKYHSLDDGRKVRGFVDPKTKTFEQIDV